jgi:phosphoenolpyruvate carboxylase
VSKDEVYLDQDELMNDLMVVHRSLYSTGNETTADGFLTDIIRNASAFGLALVPLDIRQESDRHMEALDCITRYLGLGSYAEWDEETKISWLLQQLGSNRPLIRPGDWNLYPEIFTPTAVDTLGTFQVIAEQHMGSLGAYVISQATSPSDVLAVYVLQKDAGVETPVRVAPLFETLDDLVGATATMEKLFSLPPYMGIIAGRQEIMIGYSDSAKDAGRLAANWGQYETQEKLAELAKKFKVELTFFHGKGGTVGRGGNPATFKAILAHAPDTINGRFRVTEQGEMINQNFGHGDRAERTMDIYTAAVLAEKLTQRPTPSDEWRAMMNKLSDISCEAYRKIVRGDERFVPYFRSATPELELSNLNIGSRPAKRKATGGVESLRAIPWNFAWTQTRLNLPTWLGVGEAVNEVLAGDEADKLREMYRNWGSFRTTIDLVEMVLAKSEPSIAQHYDNVLVTDAQAQELGAEVRALHVATEKAVLDLTNHSSLSDGNPILARALQVRNPYVDCLNVLQAETLKRLREADEGTEDKVLNDALLTTITGIANGMGNTG